MGVLAQALVALCAFLHLGFLYLEMFAWTQSAGLRAFRQTRERAEATRVLAANQGLYNGFLALGLIWGLLQPDAEFAFQLKLFFLGCILFAAGFGAWSVSRRILLVQGLPALAALLAVVIWANPYP